MNVLTANPGSSSLKLTVIGANDQILAADQRPAGDGDAAAVLGRFVSAATAIDAAAVRLVRGGDIIRAPVRRSAHRVWTREYGEDMPDVRDWVWAS